LEDHAAGNSLAKNGAKRRVRKKGNIFGASRKKDLWHRAVRCVGGGGGGGCGVGGGGGGGWEGEKNLNFKKNRRNIEKRKRGKNLFHLKLVPAAQK